jgi:hypothetical protein
MIGYGATNALGQGLAAREKIFSFALSYFIFFYKSLPKLSYSVPSEDGEKDLLTSISEQIEEYFEQYIIETETIPNIDPNTSVKTYNYSDRSVMAAYYLASIYYFEPTYDFTKASINDIYNIGKIYLIELFKENINQFAIRSLEILPDAKDQQQPKFPDDNPDNMWKYFTFAMLKSQFSGQYHGLIQQPVSLPSRINDKFIDYAFDKLTNLNTKKDDYKLLEDAFKQNTKEAEGQKIISTHRSNIINAKLKDVDATLVSLPVLNLSVGLYLVKSWQFIVTSVILQDSKGLWDKFWNNKTSGGSSLLQSFKNFQSSLGTTPAEQRNQAYDNLFKKLNQLIKGDTNYDFEVKFDSSKKNWEDGTVELSKYFIPENPKTKKLFDVGTKKLIFYKTEYYKGDYEKVPYINLRSILIYYKDLLESYKKYFYSNQVIIWEDSPNVIKYFDETLGYVDTGKETPNQNFIGSADRYSFITYYDNIGSSIEYPGSFNQEDRELKAYLEFSFRPNKDRLIEKLNLVSDFFEEEKFNELVNEYALNFSKTETYSFINKFPPSLENELSEKDFNSIFELCVSINFKLTKEYLNESYKLSQLSLENFDKTNFSLRTWQTETNKNKRVRNEIIYNPLMLSQNNVVLNPKADQTNFVSTKVNSIAINACVSVGFAEDYGINIRTFNPVQTFENEENANKFIQAIESTGIGEYLKLNFNYNPYSFGSIAIDLLATKASYLPTTILNDNKSLLIKSYSDGGKKLLDSLITNINTIKAGT